MNAMNDIPVQRWIHTIFTGTFQCDIPLAINLCVQLGRCFHYELGSAILLHFQTLLKDQNDCFDDLLSSFDEISDQSQTASFVATMLDRLKLSQLEKKETVDHLTCQKLLELDGKLVAPDCWLLLEIAKLLLSNDVAAAKNHLQKALSLFPPYSFYLKSQGLVSSLLADQKVFFQREVKLAVLGSTTTRLMIPVLKAAGLTKNIRLFIYEGTFGNYIQEILADDSGLYRFQPDVLLLLLESHDFPLAPALGQDHSQDYALKIRSLWKLVLSRLSCHIIQTGLDYPHIHSWGSLEDTLENGRRRQIDSVNRQLSESLPEGVSFLHVAPLAATANYSWSSPRDWHMFKQYPAPEALPLFADVVLAQTAAVFGMNKKVLILDLDNTCWGGVVGEDGLEGIQLGNSSSAFGESCLELQKYAKELKERGILLAVCSKNNESDALQVFEQHDEMILRKDDFVAFKANWNDKVSNIRSIAAELNLGLDSLVFLDDNPAERNFVRRELPEVTVPEFGNSHEKMLETLKRGMYFETVCLTHEDRERHQSYQLRNRCLQSRERITDLKAFLEKLQMKCGHGFVDDASLSRVHQLVNKTNQFNLTTRRYTRHQIQAMAKKPDWWCRWFRLTDCYQDYGITGVLFVHKQDRDWFVDTWLMSCRVIGRQLEQFMFKILLQDAKKEGCQRIHGEYIPSAKNSQVESFYPQLGFSRNGHANSFVVSTENASVPKVPVQEKRMVELRLP